MTIPPHFELSELALARPVILVYPSGAGGNFLSGCLSLPDQCVMANKILGIRQLQGSLDYRDKIRHLMDELTLAESSRIWRDFDLGPGLVGIHPDSYLSEYNCVLQRRINPLMHQVIDRKLMFFMVAHTWKYARAYLEIWPTSKFIFFVDSKSFVQDRYGHTLPSRLLKYWDSIKQPNWPTRPPGTLEEFMTLGIDLQQRLIEDYDFEIVKYFDYFDQKEQEYTKHLVEYKHQWGADRCWQWPTSCYLSSNEFFSNLQDCYRWLGLEIVDKDDILSYHKRWLYVLNLLHSND